MSNVVHHTKHKGDLGVLKAKLDLYEQGFMILNPETEHAPFDLVAYKDRKFIRVQVKYREKDKRGAISIAFATSWADKNGSHTRVYDKMDIDLFCIYCPDTDECYYIDPSKFGSTITLRVDAPKNNQGTHVMYASDCRRVP